MKLIISEWQCFLVYGLISILLTLRFAIGSVENPTNWKKMWCMIDLVPLGITVLYSQFPQVGLLFILMTLIISVVSPR